MNGNIIKDTLQIMGIGMGTVFAVLMLFFLLVKGLRSLFPHEE